MLAYQHRTLTESPIENALALAKRLAGLLAEPDAEIHVVSHSRGGLVGELLARGMRVGAAPFTPDELALFDDDRAAAAIDRRSRAVGGAGALGHAAHPVRPRGLPGARHDAGRSPARSLLLGAGQPRLADPGLKGNPVYDGLTSLLAGVLKKRTEPEELPGLEAMMPTSPLVRMLNNPDVRTAADLHVLGGDLAGAGFFGRLKTLVTDFYYRDDHDVVVNTPAMLGGIERTQPVRYWIDTGDQVTHFHYFSRPDTAQRLVSALTGLGRRFPDARGAAIGGHVGGLRQARHAVAAGRVRAARHHGIAAHGRRAAGVDEPARAGTRRPVAARRDDGWRDRNRAPPGRLRRALPAPGLRRTRWCRFRTTGGSRSDARPRRCARRSTRCCSLPKPRSSRSGCWRIRWAELVVRDDAGHPEGRRRGRACASTRARASSCSAPRTADRTRSRRC